MRDVVGALGISTAEMAELIGFDARRFCDVLNGQAPVTAALAASFQTVTGTSAVLLLAMQEDCDQWNTLGIGKNNA